MHSSPQPYPSTVTAITPATTLASLVVAWAGAARVLARHNLDFGCRGEESVEEACRRRGLEPERVVAELQAELQPIPGHERWDDRPVAQLLTHLVDHFHAGHRAELPRLVQLAAKVEAVHADAPACPRGLTDFLRELGDELETHMQREEDGVFPVLLNGRSETAALLMAELEREHLDHGSNLAALRARTTDFVPPQGAGTTWRALYLGLAEFERELMQHVHLENHVLLPRFCRRD